MDDWLEEAAMVLNMSKVAMCSDNGPMEGFQGILKRCRLHFFTGSSALGLALRTYI